MFGARVWMVCPRCSLALPRGRRALVLGEHLTDLKNSIAVGITNTKRQESFGVVVLYSNKGVILR